MSDFATEYQRVKTNILNAYDKIEEKGGTIPETKNSANLTDAIDSIETGGGFSIVSFSHGTDEDIAAMLEAHYNGQIDIADYWSVGDTRKIHLNALTFNDGNISCTWPEQDITIVITAIKQHDLATPINGITKAAITCQTRECVNNLTSNNGTTGHISWDLTRAYVTSSSKVHWSGIALRTFCNGSFLTTMMPAGTKDMIKQVSRKVLSTRGCSGTGFNGTVDKTTETVTDSIFLPTYPEIYGNVAFNYYMSNTIPAREEGTQWDYYKTASNRVKYGNNAGNPNDIVQLWWEGSPSTNYSSSYGYIWCLVNTDGSANNSYGYYAGGFAPAFAL